MNIKVLVASAVAAFSSLPVIAQQAPAPCGLVPSARQLEWYNREMIAFFHFGINTFEEYVNEGDGKADITLQLDPTVLPDKKEGYVLDAISGKVMIKANSPAGILNGVQTLRQVIKEKDGKLMVQKAIVTDYPAFSWRAFMLDEGRYFKGKEVVKQLLDEMADLKMNVFHWHLTNDQGWRIEIKKYRS